MDGYVSTSCGKRLHLNKPIHYMSRQFRRFLHLSKKWALSPRNSLVSERFQNTGLSKATDDHLIQRDTSFGNEGGPVSGSSDPGVRTYLMSNRWAFQPSFVSSGLLWSWYEIVGDSMRGTNAYHESVMPSSEGRHLGFRPHTGTEHLLPRETTQSIVHSPRNHHGSCRS